MSKGDVLRERRAGEARSATTRRLLAEAEAQLAAPTADEIVAAIETFAERREQDFIYQRDRAERAEARLAEMEGRYETSHACRKHAERQLSEHLIQCPQAQAVALAAAREQPTQDRLPLGHPFEYFGDGLDSCGIPYCGESKRAHQPTQEKP